MKRNFTFIMLFFCALVSAQDINDVLRYSSEELLGTARFQGLSGAFGALGGDISAINVNPASSAVFNNSLFTMTGAAYNRNNDATYFGSTRNSSLTSWRFNQIGGVFVWKNNQNAWKKFSLAFNYELVNNFNNEFFVQGNSNQGIDNYFLNFAQGIPFGSLLLRDGEFIEDAYLRIGANEGFAAQQAFLGYFGGVIDPVDDTDPNGTQYVSNAVYERVNQEFFQSTTGYNSKFTMNMAAQYQNTLYIGGSLNFNDVRFDRLTIFDENGYSAGSPLSFTTFDNYLLTRGWAFSFSLGAIAKLNENIRIGATYLSPVWYDLQDDFSQRINSNLADDEIDFINFNIVNLFADYTVKTPAKFIGSLGLVFGKHGLISFDYSYQNMANAELRPASDPSFSQVNSDISNQLTGVSTFRVGGEYRIQMLSLRGGYRFEQSPYEDGITIGDLNGFSGGLGLNFGGSRLDFTYSRSEQDIDQQLFVTGITTPARVTNVKNNYIISYTLNF